MKVWLIQFFNFQTKKWNLEFPRRYFDKKTDGIIYGKKLMRAEKWRVISAELRMK